MFEPVGTIEGGRSANAASSAARGSASSPAVEDVVSTDSASVPLSPRITSDPAAGVMITEYLSSTGEKQMQVPSQTVVAYLRSGLTAQGFAVRKDALGLVTEA